MSVHYEIPAASSRKWNGNVRLARCWQCSQFSNNNIFSIFTTAAVIAFDILLEDRHSEFLNNPLLLSHSSGFILTSINSAFSIPFTEQRTSSLALFGCS